MDNHQDIIDLIKLTPAMQPPESFTDGVMRRLPDLQPSILYRIKRALNRPMGRVLAPRGLLPTASTRAECAFCYILTGIFYLITGFILLLGLSGASGDGPLTQWSRIQPWIIIIAALWLSGLGGTLYLSNRTSVEVAKIATVIYILSVILSGAVVIMLYRMPVLMASTVILVISGVVMGILLHQNISRYQESRNN